MGTERVRKYLYDAVFGLFSEVKGIGGVMTITMSENLTHCHSLKGGACPRCKGKTGYELSAQVNNIIAKALRDSQSNGELIANLWGWSDFMGWTEEDALKGIDLLDKDISVLCVSEYDLPIEKGGIKSKVIDYSLSNPGRAGSAAGCWSTHGERVTRRMQRSRSTTAGSVPPFRTFPYSISCGSTLKICTESA